MRRQPLFAVLSFAFVVAAFSVAGGGASARENPEKLYKAFMDYAGRYETEARRYEAKAGNRQGPLARKYRRIASLKSRMAAQKRRIAESYLSGDKAARHDAELAYRQLQQEERRVMARQVRADRPPPPPGAHRPSPPRPTWTPSTKVVVLPPARSRPQDSPVSAAGSPFPRVPVAVTFPDAPVRPHDIAVIIGNADYGRFGAGIPDVVPAYADAEGIKRFVTTALGVREGNVIHLRDATQADLLSVFGSPTNPRGRLFNWVKPGRSDVFVYFSGHGAPAGPEGHGHLIPVNANPATLELNGYPLRTLLANLGKSRARAVTVVLEACFSGVSQGGPLITAASSVFVRPRALVPPGNVTVVSAGTSGQIASWDRDRGHSLFTKYFLLGMSGRADAAPYGNGDGWIEWRELGAYLEDTLTYDARRLYGRDQTAEIRRAAD